MIGQAFPLQNPKRFSHAPRSSPPAKLDRTPIRADPLAFGFFRGVRYSILYTNIVRAYEDWMLLSQLLLYVGRGQRS